MTVHIDLPGATTFITFRKHCMACDEEFDFVGTFDESDVATCPLCGSAEVEELYLSFPDDGPGFQKDYGTQSDRLRGGCASNCGDDFDLTFGLEPAGN